MLEPKFRSDWTKACQLWAVSAWLLLTVGIMVGAWWAYNELGWGGWWFWDPVEKCFTAALVDGDGLVAYLACLISFSATKKMTSLSLALVTFCLSILGTFIVRSGVLTSVHAFAVDPSKGLALLLILAVTLLLSFTLLLKQAEQIRSNTICSIVSRSYLVLIASGLLVVAGATVFLGTFYPMLYELVGLGAISVGAPYFNTLLEPLAILALLAMGLVPFY
ncbi:cytochrome c-type biogenesis CcmF C-terminal domain-containing protein [Vibrio sinaloensis]|nr:cytochrome c-type biogenesis CcmF C-terminal domain-containing protein [Vibrio sinaloensis]